MITQVSLFSTCFVLNVKTSLAVLQIFKQVLATVCRVYLAIAGYTCRLDYPGFNRISFLIDLRFAHFYLVQTIIAFYGNILVSNICHAQIWFFKGYYAQTRPTMVKSSNSTRIYMLVPKSRGYY